MVSWVYPRVCGGAVCARFPIRSPQGLSPRVRGSPRDRDLVARVVGSIPACAGEPGRRRPKPCRWRVYPRVCGGALRSVRLLLLAWGLSPRVRGSPGAKSALNATDGSIPACAGSLLTQRFLGVLGGSIPACAGEPKKSTHSLSPSVAGLSPRVRGSPRLGRASDAAAGSIPACAGEPLRA